MILENFKVDPILRENYEARSLIVEVFGLIGVFAFAVSLDVPGWIFFLALAYVLFFAAWDGSDAWNVYSQHKALEGKPLSFVTTKKLIDRVLNYIRNQWIGRGFAWQQKQVQKISLILATNFQSKIKNPYAKEKMGVGWIHGLGEEHELWVPVKHLEGHTLVVGNPGTGKTRLFDFFIPQCINRGETVIIIDPKGDAALRENARRACILAGKEKDFLFFHPAFPKKSIAIDPLKNFKDAGEIASRICALLPNSPGNEPFTKYSWQVLNTICQAMIYTGVPPSLVKLQRYVASLDPLVLSTIEKLAGKIDDQESKVIRYKLLLGRELQGCTSIQGKAKAAVDFYHRELEEKYHPEAVSALVNLFEHDREHYSKMNASLPPILQLLTSGSLRDLLSPSDGNPKNAVYDITDFFKTQKVVCIGLNSLANGKVGESVGSLLLADLTAVAGEIFNSVEPDKMRPVNIFVDEVCEVLNDPFVQLLNKGRGAGIRLFVATQSVSDFASKTGGEDRANQILGNINNKIAFRTLDRATQEYLSKQMPTTVIRYHVKSHGVGGPAGDSLAKSGHAEERLVEREVPLVPPQLFGMLPNLEYFALISGGLVLKGRIPILVGPVLGRVLKLKLISERLLKRFVEMTAVLTASPYDSEWTSSKVYQQHSDPTLKEKVWKK